MSLSLTRVRIPPVDDADRQHRQALPCDVPETGPLRDPSAAPAMAVRSFGRPTTMSLRPAIGHKLVAEQTAEGRWPDVKLNGERRHDHRPSLRCDELEAMLIYSMSVSVDGFIADREGGFGWTAPSEEQFRFHIAQVRELGGYLCGRRLYETMPPWETDPSMRQRARGRVRRRVVCDPEGRLQPYA